MNILTGWTALSSVGVPLVEAARAVQGRAHVPHSGYRVGAALWWNGAIYCGVNVEFDNFTNTIHAEMAALAHAIASDGMTTAIGGIAVAVTDSRPQWPCGLCRQSLFELGGPDLRVIATNREEVWITTMGELLPDGFRLTTEP